MDNKIVVTSCVALGSGIATAIGYKLYSKTVDNKENAVSNVKTDVCKCPFASYIGVGVFTGMLSGTATWFLYRPV